MGFCSTRDFDFNLTFMTRALVTTVTGDGSNVLLGETLRLRLPRHRKRCRAGHFRSRFARCGCGRLDWVWHLTDTSRKGTQRARRVLQRPSAQELRAVRQKARGTSGITNIRTPRRRWRLKRSENPPSGRASRLDRPGSRCGQPPVRSARSILCSPTLQSIAPCTLADEQLASRCLRGPEAMLGALSPPITHSDAAATSSETWRPAARLKKLVCPFDPSTANWC